MQLGQDSSAAVSEPDIASSVGVTAAPFLRGGPAVTLDVDPCDRRTSNRDLASQAHVELPG
jgi:hypothetical protein